MYTMDKVRLPYITTVKRKECERKWPTEHSEVEEIFQRVSMATLTWAESKGRNDGLG